MTALPSMPKWYKRAGALLPNLSSNEGDLVVFNGKLILAIFNRPPLAAEVRFYDLSNAETPVLLATRPWVAAMGAMLVDASGNLHIYGSNPPGRNNAPYNNLVHASVDAAFNIGPSNTIIGPSGMGFNNVTVASTPLGYVLAVEQAYPSGLKAESYIKSADPFFSSFTSIGALYSNAVDFTGKSRIRTSGAFNYVTSDSSQGYTKIARTVDFVNFKHSMSPFGFLGPDFGEDFPGTVGGKPFYNGNVSWEEWNGQVIAIFFVGNEVNNGSYRIAKYDGTLADLFGEFAFPS